MTWIEKPFKWTQEPLTILGCIMFGFALTAALFSLCVGIVNWLAQ